MKTESPTLAILAARCQKLGEHSSNTPADNEGFKLYAQWEALIARTSIPLPPREKQAVDADAVSLFNRMRNFVAYHTSEVSS
jgi:hypothetical protein